MSGERNLEKLLATMSPALIDGEFVFVTFAGARYGEHSDLDPFAAIIEPEGLSLVITRSRADRHQLRYMSILKGITLRVHSSLEAVGLTAAISSELADLGISANVLAGYFHDHIFVQSEAADQAMVALENLAARHGD